MFYCFYLDLEEVIIVECNMTWDFRKSLMIDSSYLSDGAPFWSKIHQNTRGNSNQEKEGKGPLTFIRKCN